jgi:hypothetical protein
MNADNIKYVPLSLFCLLSIKLLVVGSVLADAPILLILALLAAFYEIKSNDAKLKLMHSRCDVLDKHITDLYKVNEESRNYIAGMKLKNQMGR